MITLLLVIVGGVALVSGTTYGGYKAGQAFQNRKPKKTVEIPAKPSRDQHTMAERFLMEQEHELYPNSPNLRHVNCRVCGPGPLKRHEVPSVFDHVYHGEVQYTDDYGWRGARQGVVSSPKDADVVTSRIEGTKYHTIMLDIDLPARLIPSSTPGCSHLYIDAPMTWRQYKRVLRALGKAGVIEKPFAKISIQRGATHLRVPWKDKS